MERSSVGFSGCATVTSFDVPPVASEVCSPTSFFINVVGGSGVGVGRGTLAGGVVAQTFSVFLS